MRLLQWADIGMRALNTIELTRKIERPVIRPGQLHQLKIFRRPSIALVLWAEIPVSMLLIIRFARDDVDGKPAASQMIERGDLARKQGNQVGAPRDSQAAPFASPHKGRPKILPQKKMNSPPAPYQSRLHHARGQIRSDKPATSHLQ